MDSKRWWLSRIKEKRIISNINININAKCVFINIYTNNFI